MTTIPDPENDPEEPQPGPDTLSEADVKKPSEEDAEGPDGTVRHFRPTKPPKT